MFEYIKKFFNTNISFFIILIVVVFALYSKSINYELLPLDDKISITDNVLYISNINNIPKLFIEDVYYGHDSSYYRPILSLSFCLETIIFGYHTQVYHITNLLLFILSFYLIYLFCLKIKLDKNISKFCCLLFLVHPLFTSNAVYISPRAEMIILIFILLSFINFINYIELNKNKCFVYTIIYFLLALFTKETAVISIMFYPLILYCFKYKIGKQQIYKLSVLIFLSLIVYFIFRKISVSAISIFDMLKNYQNILTNMFTCLFIYTEKFVLCEYIPVLTYDTEITKSMIAISILLLVVIFFSYLKNIIDRKKILFCLLWYILFLAPTFVIIEQQLLFHRLLLPSVGIIIFLILLIEFILKKYPISKKYLIVLFIILVSTLTYASLLQKDKYKTVNDFILNCYLDSKNRISNTQFIDFIIKNGYFKNAKEILEEKMKEKTTKRDILFYAKLLFYEGNIDYAEYMFLQLEKDLHDKIGVYIELSKIYIVKNNYDKAFEYINKAYKTNPYDVDVLKQLALVYEKKSEYKKSLEIYNNLLSVDKNNKKYQNKINELKEKINNK